MPKRITALDPIESASINDMLEGPGKENIAPAINAPATQSALKKPKRWDALRGLVVEVEGNLGSGKSTVLKKLDGKLNEELDQGVCSVFGELINNDFLGAFYSDTKKYGFAFQMYMLTTRLYQIDEAYRQARQEEKVSFLDRGAVGDTLFAILSRKLGNMDQQDFDVYRSVCHQRMPESLSDKVDIVLYLDVDPSECHRRVTTVRGNEAEKGVPLAYLESVDSVYFELLLQWLGDKKDGDYHNMNVGACPRAVFLRWDKFGTAEEVADVLTEVANRTRKLPTVAFTKQMPPAVDLATQEEVELAYAQLQKETKIGVSSREGKVTINWNLEHTNSFRRVVMYFLSLGADLVMYEVAEVAEVA